MNVAFADARRYLRENLVEGLRTSPLRASAAPSTIPRSRFLDPAFLLGGRNLVLELRRERIRL